MTCVVETGTPTVVCEKHRDGAARFGAETADRGQLRVERRQLELKTPKG
jgi:hypothetical protein